MARDRGQAAAPLLITTMAVAVIVVLAAAELGGRVVDRNQAQTAADAVALAGVTHGRQIAERIAAEHEATITSWRSTGPPEAVDVFVEVRHGDQRATARATNALDDAGLP
ncbi:MAG: pilus assembly protein TadG-related protein [Actinomycetota bacterium]